MNLATIIVLPKTLQEKLGEDGSNDLVSLLNKITESSRLEQKVLADIDRLDKKITEEAANLKIEIGNLRADLIRWMFVFWATQFAAIVSIIVMLLKR